jgi:hypothetical protein
VVPFEYSARSTVSELQQEAPHRRRHILELIDGVDASEFGGVMQRLTIPSIVNG